MRTPDEMKQYFERLKRECLTGKGSEPNARVLRRKERDASRGSPRSFTAQKTLVQDDDQPQSAEVKLRAARFRVASTHG
jgi:hypothetical protein